MDYEALPPVQHLEDAKKNLRLHDGKNVGVREWKGLAVVLVSGVDVW